METHRLLKEAYLLPTPAGAYQAACTPQLGGARDFIFTLMSHSESRLGNAEALLEWSGAGDLKSALELLSRLQTLKLVQGEDRRRSIPEGPLAEVLPDFLTPLSSTGKALLSDQEGLYVAVRGFTHETAEELAALSADLASLHERHHKLLHRDIALRSQAWALIDAAGNSQIGFWPLHIGAIYFALVVGDMPCLNQQAFRDLIWALSRRYADTSS